MHSFGSRSVFCKHKLLQTNFGYRIQYVRRLDSETGPQLQARNRPLCPTARVYKDDLLWFPLCSFVP